MKKDRDDMMLDMIISLGAEIMHLSPEQQEELKKLYQEKVGPLPKAPTPPEKPEVPETPKEIEYEGEVVLHDAKEIDLTGAVGTVKDVFMAPGGITMCKVELSNPNIWVSKEALKPHKD